MITSFMIGLLAVAALAIITVSAITAVWLKKKVKERLDENERHKVVFADMRETKDAYVTEQEKQQKEYAGEALEKLCQKAPYVFADYDMDTGEVGNYVGVDAEKIDEDIKDKLRERGGMVVFHR